MTLAMAQMLTLNDSGEIDDSYKPKDGGKRTIAVTYESEDHFFLVLAYYFEKADRTERRELSEGLLRLKVDLVKNYLVYY